MTSPRQLLLLRHAKAADAPGRPDAERPLTQRGLDDVPLVADYAKAHGFVPGLVLCSTAVRARQTAEIFHTIVAPNAPVVLDDELYMPPPPGILACIAAAPADCRTLMVVGHNMGMEYLVKDLAGDDFLHDSMPTCGLACFDVSAPGWEDITPDNVQLVAFTPPKALRAGGAE